jgi:hypothetical protein
MAGYHRLLVYALAWVLEGRDKLISLPYRLLHIRLFCLYGLDYRGERDMPTREKVELGNMDSTSLEGDARMDCFYLG